MEEIWRDIERYEEYYQVSNLGNIRSKDRLKWNGKAYYKQKGVIKKKTIRADGYFVVNLSVEGRGKTHLVHRLIALAFIPNKNNLPVINHRDGNKLNNSLENLEWTTYRENNIHALENNLNNTRKKIKGTHVGTNEVLFFESSREADRVLKIGYKNISACLNGKQNTAGGYEWEFLN